MEKPQKEFGDYVKELRRSKGKTLDELSKYLISKGFNISLSFLSDIENKRRNPMEQDAMEAMATFLFLTEEQKAELYDLAAKRKNSVPDDVKEVIMYSPESDYIRLALRKTKTGEISKEQWEKFLEIPEQDHKTLPTDKGDNADD